MTDIRTEYWPKPIPRRDCDWEAVYDDYEPGDPIGYGEHRQDAIDDLMLNYERRRR